MSDEKLELAAQIERRNWAAARLGLPPIGSLMKNKYGIEWLVQGHVQVPTIGSLQRWRTGNNEPRLDMYPAISPQNLSPRFLAFFAAIDRCTTKAFLSLDTMPGRRNDGHVPGHNYIDTLCHQDTNFLFLDAGRIHETIIAHEMGHAWVQYVDECEDLRTMEDASNPQRMHQLAFVQSFVLDLKVNDLIRRKGFDMAPIEEDKAASMAHLASALNSGFRPESGREEVFFALLVADEMLERDCDRTHELARFHDSLATIRSELAPLASLADTFADSVRRHGYESRASIIKCIDECLIASFEHAGDHFDIDRELVIVNEPEPDLNKFPDWLLMLAPKVKCDLGRHMAKNDITDRWGQSIEPSVTGRARVTFWSPERDKRSEVLLGAHFGPPTRYSHMPELQAELMAMKHRNQTGEWQLHGGPPHPSNPPMGYDPRSPGNSPQKFGLPEGFRTIPDLQPPPEPGLPTLPSLRPPVLGPRFPGRLYMAGLGRFLTAVRLEELLGGEPVYGYAFANPVTYTDPSGNEPGCGQEPGMFYPGMPLHWPVPPPWPKSWPPGTPGDPCWQPASGHFKPVSPGPACDRYLAACRRGSILACNAYYVCMGAGWQGNISLPPISGPGADCVRGCLLSVLGGSTLASCTCAYAQHMQCFNICQWAPPWPFNWPSFSFVCVHHTAGAPDPGPHPWTTPG